MKRIDINGLGVLIEIYNKNDNLLEIEMLVQAEKAIKREIIRREQKEQKG